MKERQMKMKDSNMLSLNKSDGNSVYFKAELKEEETIEVIGTRARSSGTKKTPFTKLYTKSTFSILLSIILHIFSPCSHK